MVGLARIQPNSRPPVEHEWRLSTLPQLPRRGLVPSPGHILDLRRHTVLRGYSVRPARRGVTILRLFGFSASRVRDSPYSAF
jgi:hypothetical protein